MLYLNVDGLTNLAIAEGTVCRFTRVVGGGLEGMAAELAERRGIALAEARSLLAAVDLAAPAPAEQRRPRRRQPAVAEQPLRRAAAPPRPAGRARRGRRAIDLAGRGQPERPRTRRRGRRATSRLEEEPAAPRRPAADADVWNVLENGIRDISGEVRNSLDFHRSQEGGGEVSHVVLSGAAEEIPGFADALELALGVPVRPRGRRLRRRAPAASTSPRTAWRSPPASPPRRLRSESRQPDPRRAALGGSAVGAGRSQGAAYALLALVAGLAVMTLLYGLASHQISSDKQQAAALAERTQQAAGRDRRARALHELHRRCARRASKRSRSSSTRASTGPTPSTNSAACSPRARRSPRSAARSSRRPPRAPAAPPRASSAPPRRPPRELLLELGARSASAARAPPRARAPPPAGAGASGAVSSATPRRQRPHLHRLRLRQDASPRSPKRSTVCA